MKIIIKKLFVTVFITLIVLCSLIPTLAIYADINAKTTRIATLNPFNNCKSTQSLSVTSTGANNRLFVVRLNSDNPTIATLYMYKDYTSMNNSESDEYGTFILSDLVGHANGMAIDDNYIYISCWDNTNSDSGRKIARISRSKLWSMYNSTNEISKGMLTQNSDGVTILTAKYKNNNEYDKNIFGITYYKDGEFIVMTLKTTDTENGVEYYNFTKGYVDNDKLVISDNPEDKFQVAFEAIGTSGQDIGYDPDCGFFITRFIGGTQNAIIWIKLNSLSGENRVYTADNSNYRIIRVNKSAEIFELYELEAVSIGSDNYMYASVNVHLQEGATYPEYQKDPIIKIERPSAINGTTKFLGNNITL